jgi:hypothetical protein
MPRSPWPLHDDVVPILQVADKVIGHEFRHQIIPVAEPAATVALKGEAQREAKLIGIGRT